MPLDRSLEQSCALMRNLIADPVLNNNRNCKHLLTTVKVALQTLSQCKEDPGSDSIKQRAISLLQAVDAEVDKLQFELGEKKAAALHIKLKKAQEKISLASTSLVLEKPVSFKIDMQLAFLCDVDAPDQNGVIEDVALNIMRSKVPFITTRSLLNSTKNTVFTHRMEKLLLKEAHLWTIYEQQTADSEGFLVFIPRSTNNDNEAQQLLAEYDFKNDESLKKISPLQALTLPDREVNFESFSGLFNENPGLNKLFFIAGHGGVGSPVAGLTAGHYEMLLTELKRQKCMGMTVCSCYAGGKSSLLHLKKFKGALEASLQAEYRQLPRDEPLKFPVILRSIGDFPSKAFQEAEADFAAYFTELARYLESNSGQTLAGLRAAVSEVESNAEAQKSDLNLAQVYFPSDADSPSGFRPIGEKGQSYSLTFGKMQGEKLLAHSKGIDEPKLHVDNKKFVEIHPVEIDLTLICQKSNPLLLSMIPGAAYHYLKGIHLAHGSLEQFFAAHAHFYAEAELGVPKSFHVGSLVAPSGKKWNNVVIHLEPNKSTCLYSHEGIYYGIEIPPAFFQALSPLQYALALEAIVAAGEPDSLAIRSQSGGQQSRIHFADLNQNVEISKKLEQFNAQKISEREAMIQNQLDKEQLSSIVQGKVARILVAELLQEVTSDDDKNAIAFHLVKCGRPDLVQVMLEDYDLSPNMMQRDGVPLIVAAAMADSYKLVSYLLEQGCDPNSSHPYSGDTLLHFAVRNNNSALINALLAKGANLEAVNKSGQTPIFATLSHNTLDAFEVLKLAGANINAVTRDGGSLLTHALRQVFWGNAERSVFTRYLAQGIDPNVGDLTPLNQAILNNDCEAVDLLLKKGARLDVATALMHPPIFDAIERLSPKMTGKLLKRDDYNSMICDSSGITPLILALRQGRSTFVRALLDRNATLQLPIKQAVKEKIREGCARMAAGGNFSALEALLQHGVPPQYETLIISEMIQLGQFDLIRKWISAELFKDHTTLLLEIISSGNVELAGYCLEWWVPAEEQPLLQPQALNCAVISGNCEMVKLLRGKMNPLPMDNIDKAQLLLMGYLKGGKEMFNELYPYSNAPVMDLDLASSFWQAVVRANDMEIFDKMTALARFTDDTIKCIINASATCNQEMMCRELEKRGYLIDSKAIDDWNWEELGGAALDYFLDRMSNVTDRQEQVQNVFDMALYNGRVDVVQQLIDRGADVNAAGMNDFPIFVAIAAKNLTLVQLLVREGTDLQVISQDAESHGQSVLDVARNTGDQAIIDYLSRVQKTSGNI